MPGGVAPRFGSEKVSRYTGVSQLQLRVSRYTVQLSRHFRQIWAGEMPENSRKFWVLDKNAKQKPDPRNCRNAHSGDLEWAFWDDLPLGCAKGAEKASCGETVVQKGVFGESVSSLPS